MFMNLLISRFSFSKNLPKTARGYCDIGQEHESYRTRLLSLEFAGKYTAYTSTYTYCRYGEELQQQQPITWLRASGSAWENRLYRYLWGYVVNLLASTISEVLINLAVAVRMQHQQRLQAAASGRASEIRMYIPASTIHG